MLRELAEYPNSYGPLGPSDERIEDDRFTLWMGSGKRWSMGRLAADPADAYLT